MKLKRWISLWLVAMMLFAAVGCQPASTPTGDGEESGDMLTLVNGGQSAYQIVRSDSARQEVKDAFLALRDAVALHTGKSMTIDTDWADEISTEILIGNTKREASGKVAQKLKDLQELGDLVGQSFAVCVRGEQLLIVGTDDEATAYGVQYFIETYVAKAKGGTVAVPRDLEVTMTVADLLLQKKVTGSALKYQYSDFVDSYTETPLMTFDTLDIPGVTLYEKYELDEYYAREGDAALRFTMVSKDRELTALMWPNGQSAFDFSAVDTRKTTMKLWVYVNDTDSVSCDHDSDKNKIKDQATFFFRAADNKGRIFCWNHTITGDGWHEIELTFNINNGCDAAFDFAHIASFGVMVSADKGTIIELDDLRAVHYTSDYTPEAAPDGGRLITDGEYNAFDGVVLPEWYGCSYDVTDKKFGNSSIRSEGDDSVSDFRVITSNLNIPLDYDEDVLVFWMKVDDLSTIDGLFIELNYDQDVHEYEYIPSKAVLKQYGLSDKSGEWCQIIIPLSDFEQHLAVDRYGEDPDITLRTFRLSVNAHPNKSYVVHFDRMYITTKSALGMS